MPGSTSGLVSEDETRERMPGLVWIARAKVIDCWLLYRRGARLGDNSHSRRIREGKRREEMPYATSGLGRAVVLSPCPLLYGLDCCGSGLGSRWPHPLFRQWIRRQAPQKPSQGVFPPKRTPQGRLKRAAGEQLYSG